MLTVHVDRFALRTELVLLGLLHVSDYSQYQDALVVSFRLYWGNSPLNQGRCLGDTLGKTFLWENTHAAYQALTFLGIQSIIDFIDFISK